MNICISCCIVPSECVRKDEGGHSCNGKLIKGKNKNKEKEEEKKNKTKQKKKGQAFSWAELCNLREPFSSLSNLTLGKQHDKQNGAKADCPSDGITYY